MGSKIFINSVGRFKVIEIIIAYSFVIIAFNMASLYMMDFGLCQLDSILRSNYHYSANTQNVKPYNCFLQFDAEIVFSPFGDLRNGLNAEIVMLSNSSDYTDVVDWKPQKLTSDGIAISKFFSVANKLKMGDILFSKNPVNGEVRAYTIEQILPNVKCIRVIPNQIEKDGIVIIGYDKQYDEKIKHEYICFYDDNTTDMGLNDNMALNNVIYRDEELKMICKKICPYTLISLVSCICIILQSQSLIKRVKPYYLQCLEKGSDFKILQNSLKHFNMLTGGLTIIIAIIVTIIGSCINGVVSIKIIYLIILCVLEFLSMMSAVRITIRNISRNNGG